MGVNLRDIIPEQARQEIDLKALKGYVIALDAYNMLYQFLSAIRQPDGTPLKDSQGRVTSHLSGLFYRTVNLVEEGIKPVYVFDGKPPELKRKEIEERIARRREAAEKYLKAKETGALEEARKYAQASSELTNDMVAEAKRLLDAMGIPWVQAPADGEAQAAYMARRGDAWAAGSQDYDSLLFGSPRLVRNLAITGKRKLPNKDEYVEVRPEIIDLNAMLKLLGITREQLIVLGILVGTDFDPEGVKGYGAKTALNFVKVHRDPQKALELIKTQLPEADPFKIYDYFLNPPVNQQVKVEFREPDVEAIKEILVKDHDFSEDRVLKAADRLKKAYRENLRSRQSRLDMWFGA
ncbi:MAG: flap endonuclease-1 [Acidilobus sp.]